MHVQAAVLKGEDQDEEDDDNEEEGNSGGSRLYIACSTASFANFMQHAFSAQTGAVSVGYTAIWRCRGDGRPWNCGQCHPLEP